MGEPQTINIVKISSSIFIVLLLITVLAGTIMVNTSVSADEPLPTDTKSATASVNVSAACSMSSTVDTAHSANITPGTWQGNIGQTSMTVTCNDPGGYAIYAVGYSNDEWKNTNLISTNGSTIGTNTNTSGNTSGWSMKLSTGTAPTTSGGATIISPYNDYAIVPGGSVSNPNDKQGSFAKVATYNATTTGTTGSSLTSTYGAYVASAQPAGTYTGKVKYTLVHPNDAPAPTNNLYQTIANMSKGKQTLADIQTELTAANSGVYEYNSDEFGTASDAANISTIYYYRGILDETTGTYGSDGDGERYPNYVKLDNDTCWRIVRTTGSGGVKMIYNGIYGATTSGSCANAQANAQLITIAYGAQGASQQTGTDWRYNASRVGYTYNGSIDDLVDVTTPVGTVFGDNSNYTTTNTTNSNIKNYIESDWYNSSMTNYTSILEPSAGYCNDRTAYSDNTTSTALSTISPFKTETTGQNMWFGAYGRNYNAANAGKTPSLTCARGTVDLYSYSSGVGNGQLDYPVALLTADEASLAGSGRTNASQGSAKNEHSFACSGSNFWLLSPSNRQGNGAMNELMLASNSIVNPLLTVSSTGPGVRPVISITSGTNATSGSGTATDPWVVNSPSS